MLCLKYPEPEEVSQGHPAGSVFVLPPQGQPGASRATRDNLERLRGHLQKQLGPVTRICCQPQRVGVNSSVAVALEGRSGQQVNLLLTVMPGFFYYGIQKIRNVFLRGKVSWAGIVLRPHRRHNTGCIIAPSCIC